MLYVGCQGFPSGTPVPFVMMDACLHVCMYTYTHNTHTYTHFYSLTHMHIVYTYIIHLHICQAFHTISQ